MKTMVASAAALAPLNDAGADGQVLTWTPFPAGEQGFYRAPVLVAGAREAVLIDGGFTYPDGQALARAIKVTGKNLTTIYVSQSDPDYYFSLKEIIAAFPQAQVLAASATIAAIKANVEKKLATWGPQLGEHGPQTLADVVMPKPFDGPAITVDGKRIDIVDAETPDRRYLWSSDLQAIFGGVMVFSGVHVWTADTPTAEGRAAWIRTLDVMAARHPKVVVPGHMAAGVLLDASAIAYTKAYLLAFENELAEATNADSLIAAMLRRYPHAGMGVALEIGAKVAKGEMAWGV